MPRVYEDEHVTVEQLADLGPYANDSYIVRPTGGGPATVIDIPEGFEQVLAALDGAPVERVVVTHSHADHWNGYDVMRRALDCPVLTGAEETAINPARPVTLLADGDELAVGGATMRVLHTPGHTPGSICLLLGGALFSGDTLFPGGPGRTAAHADLETEIASITARLLTLPGEIAVLPGHGATTTIAEAQREYEVFAAREHNPDLHGDVLWLES